ncbi:hypothetical protein L596_013406 [Steinernema carpocapsae]|uniref:SRR1-like domain-containing protein n=1 Tax=Steinernema carpocapsae TaxID=34508 RepID=A0A4U5P020_STECR|nr:hypothetical protein L596_013406 [Steinernema carpocapsae]
MDSKEDIAFNVKPVRDHFDPTGFTKKYLKDLKKILKKRRIKRISILGFGIIAHPYELQCDPRIILQELALVLKMKDYFKVSETTSQEPYATNLDREFLTSTEVASCP